MPHRSRIPDPAAAVSLAHGDALTSLLDLTAAVVIAARGAKILSASMGACELLQQEPGSLENRSMLELLHLNDQPLFMHKWCFETSQRFATHRLPLCPFCSTSGVLRRLNGSPLTACLFAPSAAQVVFRDVSKVRHSPLASLPLLQHKWCFETSQWFATHRLPLCPFCSTSGVLRRLKGSPLTACLFAPSAAQVVF
ncbi:unnamed protein product [Closterium sp. NIES-65]|nr:unnamed protein product [Closterium sp. NIES-65]